MPAQGKTGRPKARAVGIRQKRRDTGPQPEQLGLVEQYRKALAEYRIAEGELKEVLGEYEDLRDELAGLEENEASQKGEQGEEAAQVSDLKKHLAELEAEIDQTEEELRQIRAASHSSIVGMLNGESEALVEDNEAMRAVVASRRDQVLVNTRAIAAVISSDDYDEVVHLEAKIEKLTRKQSYLRGVVDKKRLSVDATTGVQKQGPLAKELRGADRQKAEVDLTLDRHEEQKARRGRKWDAQALKLISYVEELNEQLEALGAGDKVVDVEALKSKYVGQASS